MKVIILVAGEGKRSQVDYLKALQALGGRKVLDYSLYNALTFSKPEDIYLVVGYQKEKVREHLGERYHYIHQDPQLGTGHAVFQAKDQLKDYRGSVLILYGDTPLFKTNSIRGLFNRHQIKQPALTIFTAVIDNPPPYGRVIRDNDGNISAIIEESDAAPETKGKIKEINIGAYVGQWEILLSALDDLDRDNAQSEYLLTDVVKHCVKKGHTVESYQTYDSEEILGINTSQDLRQAEFIIQKQAFRPLRQERENLICFGTGGWRAIIGEGFTFDNVRRFSQAIANRIMRESGEKKGVVIGFDRRFLSNEFANAIAEVMAGNNIQSWIFPNSCPTPVVTYATRARNAIMGLIVTASHNAPEYNGIKVQLEGGRPISDEVAQSVEEEANSLSNKDVITTDLKLGLQAGIVKRSDYTNQYIDFIESQINMRSLRNADLKVVLDLMYGVGQATLGTILTEAKCHITTLHERHDPLFGGKSPAPDINSLGVLQSYLKEGDYDLGLATDGDADRIAVVDSVGRYISANWILLMLYYYLHEYKGQYGPVVRNVATTHLLDRLARHFGEKCIEVPVGFKFISQAIEEHDALLGGESSGGLTVRGHILGKDGVFAAVLILEMLANSGKAISELRNEIVEIVGELQVVEQNIPCNGAMKAGLYNKLHKKKVKNIGNYPVLKVSQMDGAKYILEGDNWVLIRFSGTEPVLRILAEADTAEKASELIQEVCGIFAIELPSTLQS